MKQEVACYECDCCGKVVSYYSGVEECSSSICFLAPTSPDYQHEKISVFLFPEIELSFEKDRTLVSSKCTELHLCEKCAAKFRDEYIRLIKAIQTKYCECLS